MLNKYNKSAYLKRYNLRLNKYGYDPKTLGWGGGYERQRMRYRELLKISDFIQKDISSLLDVGCGFADLYKYIKEEKLEIAYKGIDINEELLRIGKQIHGHGLDIEKLDIADPKCNIPRFDLVLESGIFNAKLKKQNQIEYIESMLKKMFDLAEIGVAADFMTTKVDWQSQDAFHLDPSCCLKMCLGISKKVVVRHDYLPYEFLIYLIR